MIRLVATADGGLIGFMRPRLSDTSGMLALPAVGADGAGLPAWFGGAHAGTSSSTTVAPRLSANTLRCSSVSGVLLVIVGVSPLYSGESGSVVIRLPLTSGLIWPSVVQVQSERRRSEVDGGPAECVGLDRGEGQGVRFAAGGLRGGLFDVPFGVGADGLPW